MARLDRLAARVSFNPEHLLPRRLPVCDGVIRLPAKLLRNKVRIIPVRPCRRVNADVAE